MKLAPDEQRIVGDILRKHVPEHRVLAFGSRVHGRNLKPFSDLDLAIITDDALALDCLLDLRAAFSESDLPFRVDIVDWASADPAFRSIIGAQHEVLSQGIAVQPNRLESLQYHVLPTGHSVPDA